MDSLKKTENKNSDSFRNGEKADHAQLQNDRKESEPVFSELITSEAFLKLHDRVVTKLHGLSRLFKNSGRKNLKKRLLVTKKRILKKDTKKVVNNFRKLKFVYSSSFFLAFLSVTLLVVAVVIGLNLASARAQNLSESAYENIELSYKYMEAGDLTKALESASNAKFQIRNLKLLTQSWGQDSRYLRTTSLGDTKFTAYERMLDATYMLIDSASQLESQFTHFNPTSIDNSTNAVQLDVLNAQASFVKWIELIEKNISTSKKELLTAKEKIGDDLGVKIEATLYHLDTASERLEYSKSFVNKDLTWLFGLDGKEKNLLILFQNNAELRGGSGGSLGSFGIAKLKSGNIQSINFGKNIFKIDQEFEKSNYIEPPQEIKFLRGNKSWTLKDSGWAVDGVDALKNVALFYQKETGESVDGVIMVDTTAISDILREIGPIELREYAKTINADNLRSELELEAHQDYWKKNGSAEENEPKKIISEMMPIFFSKFFGSISNKEQMFTIVESLKKSIFKKDILLYFEKQDLQEKLESLNMSGKVQTSFGDYLYLNNSNIDGGKSSLNISEQINFDTTIANDGKINNKLNIIRTHTGTGIFPDGLNKNFVRMLVPENATLETFEPLKGNFEQMANQGYKDKDKPSWLSEESGKKVINYWMSTAPKETGEVQINYDPGYRIKVDNEFVYNLMIQKQPGATASKVALKIHYPGEFIPVGYEKSKIEKNEITINSQLESDLIVKIKFIRNNK